MHTKRLIAALLLGIFCVGAAACGGEEHEYVLVEGTDATCTEAGVCTHYHCNGCGKDFAYEDRTEELETVTIPPLGHDYSVPVTNRASCTEPGTVECVCRRCGNVERTQLAAGEHLFRSYITEPTCLKEGQSYRICLMCGYSEKVVLPATGKHEFNTQNVCTLCNLRCVPSAGLKYEMLYDNGMQVGYKVSCGRASGNIVVPYYYDSLPVLEVANDGFFGENITGFICYAPLRTIGDRAFMSCEKLPSFTFPDTLVRIGEEAFSSCASLTSISIPDSVTDMGRNAFYLCTKLQVLEIGAGLPVVESFDFWNCEMLSVIRVSEFNRNLKSEGNCLIDRETNTLLLGSSESQIPEGITVIGKNAFYGRRGLTKIVLPGTITQICDFAFCDCVYLNEIEFEGSQEAWDLIEKGTEWNYHTDSEFKVSCTA